MLIHLNGRSYEFVSKVIFVREYRPSKLELTVKEQLKFVKVLHEEFLVENLVK